MNLYLPGNNESFHPLFTACNCNSEGSTGQQCDQISGQCPCSEKHQSLHCDSCLRGQFGFPDCMGSYDPESTAPQLLVVEGHYRSHYDPMRSAIRYPRRPLLKSRNSYYDQLTNARKSMQQALNNNGQLSGTTTVDGIDALYLGEKLMNQIAETSEGFDYKMAATLNDFCVLCKTQGSSYQCKSFSPSKGDKELEASAVAAPGFADGEVSFLVSLKGGIFSVRSDYQVDTMPDIDEPWKTVRVSSFSLLDKFGGLECAAKLNDTTIVGLSAKRNYGEFDALMLVFFDVQESEWRPGSKLSGPSNTMKALLNCQMSGDSTLLVEIIPSDQYDYNILLHTYKIGNGQDLDSDWHGIKRDFDPSWGTLVTFSDGLLYVGGVSGQDSRALLYKNKQSSKWVKLDQELNKDRVKPAICSF